MIDRFKFLLRFGALITLVGFLMGVKVTSYKGKKLKGQYWENVRLVDQIKGEQPCRIDSGEGVVIRIQTTQSNEQFGSETNSSLLLWLADWPPVGQKYYLQEGQFMLCYQEVGDLLLFETFRAQGWIQLSSLPEKGKVKGALEIDLIEPHHNFSNSDFQYMGGSFMLNFSELKEMVKH